MAVHNTKFDFHDALWFHPMEGKRESKFGEVVTIKLYGNFVSYQIKTKADGSYWRNENELWDHQPSLKELNNYVENECKIPGYDGVAPPTFPEGTFGD